MYRRQNIQIYQLNEQITTKCLMLSLNWNYEKAEKAATSIFAWAVYSFDAGYWLNSLKSTTFHCARCSVLWAFRSASFQLLVFARLVYTVYSMLYIKYVRIHILCRLFFMLLNSTFSIEHFQIDFQSHF